MFGHVVSDQLDHRAVIERAGRYRMAMACALIATEPSRPWRRGKRRRTDDGGCGAAGRRTALIAGHRPILLGRGREFPRPKADCGTAHRGCWRHAPSPSPRSARRHRGRGRASRHIPLRRRRSNFAARGAFGSGACSSAIRSAWRSTGPTRSGKYRRRARPGRISSKPTASAQSTAPLTTACARQKQRASSRWSSCC